MVKGINYNIVFIDQRDANTENGYGITPADVLNDAHVIIIRLSPSYNNGELIECAYTLVKAVVKDGDNYLLIDPDTGQAFAMSVGYNAPFTGVSH